MDKSYERVLSSVGWSHLEKHIIVGTWHMALTICAGSSGSGATAHGIYTGCKYLSLTPFGKQNFEDAVREQASIQDR